jgi:hypothetical protein
MVVLLVHSAVAALFVPLWLFYLLLCCSCSVCPTMVVLLVRSAVAALFALRLFNLFALLWLLCLPHYGCFVCCYTVAALFAPLWLFYLLALLWLLCLSYACFIFSLCCGCSVCPTMVV